MSTPEADDQPSWRRKLEADAKAGRAASAEAQQWREERELVTRELVFRRAGVDPDTRAGQLLFKGYDGALDLGEIRSQAAEIGALANAAPSYDAGAMSRISQAQSGGFPSGGYAPAFGSELDSIPEYVRGPEGHMQQNPDYINQVLAATRVQAQREGKQFEVSSGSITYQKGGAGPAPAINPLSGG